MVLEIMKPCMLASGAMQSWQGFVLSSLSMLSQKAALEALLLRTLQWQPAQELFQLLSLLKCNGYKAILLK